MALEFFQRQLLQLAPSVDAVAHHPADRVVSGAEAEAPAHEVVRQVGGVHEALLRGRGHALATDLQPVAQLPRHGQACRDRVDGVEQRLLVLLEVAVIGQRQPLHDGQERVQVAVHPPGLAADQLGHVGVLLLRHHGAARAVGVRQLDEPELLARPQDQLVGHAAQVHEEDGGRGQELQHEVPVAHGVDAVPGYPREAQELGHVGPVDGKGGARQGAGAQGHDVGLFPAVAVAALVALEHLHVGQQVVREEHGLGALQVRVAGHQHVLVAPRGPRQRLPQRLKVRQDAVERVPQVEPHVQIDLVVAAPGGVELLAHGADLLGQPPLDVHVNVFVGDVEGKRAALDLLLNGAQSGDDLARLARGDDALLSEHSGVGDAAGDVVTVEAPVHVHGGGEGHHGIGGGAGEPAAPELFLLRHAPYAPATRPAILSRSAFSLMNPSASAWL